MSSCFEIIFSLVSALVERLVYFRTHTHCWWNTFLIETYHVCRSPYIRACVHTHTHTPGSRTRVFIKIRSDFDQPYLHTCVRACVPASAPNRLNFVHARTLFEVHTTPENPASSPSPPSSPRTRAFNHIGPGTSHHHWQAAAAAAAGRRIDRASI